MTEGPVDLIRLEGHGNSVILRITGTQDASARMLSGEFLVETPFVRGSLKALVFSEDLWAWRDALDGLDAGHDVSWREDGRTGAMFVERTGDEALVTIKDDHSTTTVSMTVPLTDQWFDDAYDRLDLTLQSWPLTEDSH